MREITRELNVSFIAVADNLKRLGKVGEFLKGCQCTPHRSRNTPSFIPTFSSIRFIESQALILFQSKKKY